MQRTCQHQKNPVSRQKPDILRSEVEMAIRRQKSHRWYSHLNDMGPRRHPSRYNIANFPKNMENMHVARGLDKIKLSQLLDKIENISTETGLEINRGKTRIMMIDRANNNQNQLTEINDITIVNHFVYSGPMITDTGGEQQLQNNAMAKLPKIRKSYHQNQIGQMLGLPSYLYASECWTLKEADKKSIQGKSKRFLQR
ncbi:hypothetical protein ILUMI_17845 [Ignelater luminosus]|uniref:Uncharacterized protein n=1 Tax=Ignelater luminosus TaxID=2038154 RepID=A0A8K0G7I3_IGNLU|nr:hypothetical protein ILUMI_17845 [Ignelater luminosus]